MDVYGGFSYRGNALNNSVNISGSTISGSIYGGYTTVYSGSSSYADGNINGDVYGGYIRYLVSNRMGLLLSRQSPTYQSINNTITISGDARFSSNPNIYGGFTSANGDSFTGNTLNFSAKPITVSSIANFEHYNFTIDPTLVNNEALITTDNITLGDGNSNSKIQVNAIHAGRD